MKWKPPKTNEELVEIYDHIYRQKNGVKHKVKGKLGPYGSHDNRDPPFVDFLKRKYPNGKHEDGTQARVLDASTGRGHLARTLMALGFDVEATEISPWLIEHELQDLNVQQLRYDQFDQLPSKRYDAVISNDVLEHLLDEAAVREAVREFKRLTKKWVLVSVGTKRRTSGKYPEALKMSCGPLHLFVPGPEWWEQFFEKELVVVEKVDWPSNFLAFGKLHEQEAQ